ncbi:hypothetical protein VCRA2133E348_800001 [Vibrio crassostreae]|nr:hypothetical protein VCRA2133E348_800001 [Vibrio crassostreae]CAK3668236.1 hypothetical protein VCRA213O314_850001 [Vibrio crassostreae]
MDHYYHLTATSKEIEIGDVEEDISGDKPDFSIHKPMRIGGVKLLFTSEGDLLQLYWTI